MRRPAALVALPLVATVVAVACSSGHVKPAPPPAELPTEPVLVPTTASDLETVPIAGVTGRSLSPRVVVGPGRAALNGVVTGPTGPVAGATVLAERVAGGGVADVTVQSNADGTYAIPNILGGLFRVRAWQAPTLANTQPAVIFLGGTETRTINIVLAQYGSTQVQSSVAPNPPIIGWTSQLAVSVTSATVGNDGIVRFSPVPGATVQVGGSGQWTVDGSTTEVTGGDGIARWDLVCQALGPQPLSVVVNGGDVVGVDVAPCSPVPTTEAPTTTTPERTSTTVRHRSTTTVGG